MNCGRNDRKNSATFGLKRFTTNPWPNARRTLIPGRSGSNTGARVASVRMPT